jgi:hypothetical protein
MLGRMNLGKQQSKEAESDRLLRLQTEIQQLPAKLVAPEQTIARGTKAEPGGSSGRCTASSILSVRRCPLFG